MYRVFVVRWIPFLAIALLLVWALLAAVPYGASYVTLRGLSRAQRGEAAADETRSFLTRAGRVDLRRRLQERDEWQKRRPSAPANAWRWGYEESLRLPPDAKIYLNDPRVALYFYGTFFWYPARLDATPEPEVITGHASLARHARPIAGRDFSELARRGYTHVVIRAHERFEIVDLEAAEEP